MKIRISLLFCCLYLLSANSVAQTVAFRDTVFVTFNNIASGSLTKEELKSGLLRANLINTKKRYKVQIQYFYLIADKLVGSERDVRYRSCCYTNKLSEEQIGIINSLEINQTITIDDIYIELNKNNYYAKNAIHIRIAGPQACITDSTGKAILHESHVSEAQFRSFRNIKLFDEKTQAFSDSVKITFYQLLYKDKEYGERFFNVRNGLFSPELQALPERFVNGQKVIFKNIKGVNSRGEAVSLGCIVLYFVK